MRSFFLTFVPMILMAIFVVGMGERMARREVVRAIPIDQKRLSNFVADFENEIERVEMLYLDHLKRITRRVYSEDQQVEEDAREIVAFHSIYHFKGLKLVKHLKLKSLLERGLHPEVRLEGQQKPRLFSKRVVTILTEKRNSCRPEVGQWLSSDDGMYPVYWVCFDAQNLVAIVIDKQELNQVIDDYMKEWCKPPSRPLRESSIHFSIESPLGQLIQEGQLDTRGAAALIMPKQFLHGTWQIKAWDGIARSSHHESSVLVVAFSIAIALLLAGFLLYKHQQSSLKLARQRVSFVNQVSHELGSPLTNMSLNLDLAMDTLGEEKKHTKHRLNLVSQEIGRLNRLVGNVLTFSRCDRGVLEIHEEACLPDVLIGDLLDSWRPALSRREIAVEYDPNIVREVRTDPDAITQIISNLISNVEKYAYAGKWLGIQTSLDDEVLVVTVRDRGPGVNEGAQKKIFRSFERLDSGLNEGSSGAGLGLSIARELARKMRGDLFLLDSECGCQFSVSIPVQLVGVTETPKDYTS